MRLLGISGSLRDGSYNRRLLEEAGGLEAGRTEFAVYPALRDLPPYDPDLDGASPPEAVRHLRQAVAGADAVLIATPEYNGTIPGPLKNAVDWLSRPFPDNALRGKAVAVIGATTGRFGAVWAQADLRKALGLAGARVLRDAELALPRAQDAFGPDGLRSNQVRQQLDQVVEALLGEAGAAGRAKGSQELRRVA